MSLFSSQLFVQHKLLLCSLCCLFSMQIFAADEKKEPTKKYVGHSVQQKKALPSKSNITKAPQIKATINKTNSTSETVGYFPTANTQPLAQLTTDEKNSDFLVLEDYLNYLTDEEKEEISAKYLRKLGHKYANPNFRIALNEKSNLPKRIENAKSKQERYNLRQRLIAQQYITTLGHKFKRKTPLPGQPEAEVKGKRLNETTQDINEETADIDTVSPNNRITKKPSQSSQIPDGEELLLVMQVDKLVLDAIFAFKQGNGAFIGLESVFSVLDFPIVVDAEAKQAKGWFIRENNYFNFTTLATEGASSTIKVTVDGKDFIVPNHLVRFEGDDIYVHSNELFKWLDFKYDISFNDLTLTIKPKVKLPLQLRLARESQLGKLSITRISEPVLPRRETPYKLFSVPFVDVQMNASQSSNNSTTDTRANYSLLGKGDLAYMTASYFINGTKDDAFENSSFRLDRESTNNDLLGPLKLSQISLGDISSVRLPLINGSSPQEKGIRVSNSPLNKPTNFNSTNFEGDILPEWDIELYHNNILIETQRAGEDGRYEFTDINLYFGDNDFKMIFYGPQGQVRERLESIPVNTSNVLEGNFFYDLSVTKQDLNTTDTFDNQLLNSNSDDDNDYRLAAQFRQGITDAITMHGGFTSYKFLDGTRHSVLPIGFDIFTKQAKFNIGYIKDFDGGTAFEGSVKTKLNKHTIDFSTRGFSEDYATNVDQTSFPKNNHSIRFSGPLMSLNNINLSYTLSAAESTRHNGVKSNFYSFFTGTNIAGYRLSNSLRYNKITLNNNSDVTSLNGNFALTKSFNAYRVRSRLDYSLQDESKITNFDTSVLWPITSGLLTEVGIGVNEQVTTGRMNLSWDTDPAVLTAFASYNSDDAYQIGLNLRFSFGVDPKTNHFNISKNRIANTGGISARVFEDINYDGIYNENEPLIEGAKISGVNARRSAYSDPSGIAFLTGLPKNRVTDVQLELDSLEDPFWVPLNEGFSFMPRPGLLETFDVPIVTSGEIDGYIYLLNENGVTQAGRYVPLELIDENGKVVMETNSEFDGFYLLSSIRPGNYTLQVKPGYLLNKDLVQMSKHNLTIKGNGTIINAENIELKVKGLVSDVPEAPKDKLYLNLGDYSSKNNLNILWLLLRTQYPTLLKYPRLDEPVNKAASENLNDNTKLSLRLVAPISERNDINSLCDTLRRAGKTCFIE